MTNNDNMNEFKTHELERWKNLDFKADMEDNYVSDEKIVVIGGCGRSGTTLLRVMLDTHSRIASGPVSQLFLPLEIQLNDLSKKFDIDVKTLETMLNTSNSKVKFIEMFIRFYLQKTNKTIWADKTSRNIHRISYILKHFPNARIIHMIRNGRDVVASLKTHKKRITSEEKLVATGFIMPFQNCIDRWLLSINNGLPFRDNTNYIEVRYEDLVFRTNRTLNDICRFIGVEFEQTMMHYYTIDSRSRNPLNFPHNTEATRPISIQSVGRWQRDLNEGEIEQVILQIDPIMEQIGYTETQNVLNVDRKPYLAIPIVDAPIVEQIINNDMYFIKEHVLKAFAILKTDEFHITQAGQHYLQRKSVKSSCDRIIAEPFYLEGKNSVAGMKWIGSHENNYLIGMNRASSILILNNTTTNAPICIMDGGVINSMKTFAISIIAIEMFVPSPKKIACIGMGKLGRMHASALSKYFPTIEKILCFSSESKFEDILNDKIIKCNTWLEAIQEADIIITTTSANEPYISSDDINGDKLIINLSLMDFDVSVFQKSSLIIVDNWFQCTQAKSVFKQGVDSGIIQRHRVIELGDLIVENKKNNKDLFNGIIMVNALGMAIEDIIIAQAVHDKLMYMSTIKPNYFYMDNRLNPLTDPPISSSITTSNPHKKLLQKLEQDNEELQNRVTMLEQEIEKLQKSSAESSKLFPILER